jgi:hypothetical protein
VANNHRRCAANPWLGIFMVLTSFPISFRA